jgi:hypothetical protein
MKKTRRLLSMLLATVMVLCLMAPALAADTIGGATQSSTVDNPIETIPVSKKVTVDTWGVSLPSETFYLQMSPATPEQLKDADGKSIKIGNATVQAGIALKEPVVSFDFSAANSTSGGSVTQSGAFNLEFNSAFTATGVYRYYIQEVAPVESEDEDAAVTYEPVENPETEEGEKNYIEYDERQYTVDLYVEQDSNKNFVVTTAAVNEVGADSKPASITFTNKINCATVIIKKEVDGIEYTKDEGFNFKIMIPVGGDTITLKKGEKISAQIYKDGVAVADGAVTLEVKGDSLEASVAENGTEFTLHDGEYLQISAPLSMVYKVQEDDYTGEDYVATALYQESGSFLDSHTLKNNGKTFANAADEEKGYLADDVEGNALCVTGTANDGTSHVTFTNTRKIDVETGINLDFLPYVLVLVGALAIGGVWFFFRKRRMVR